MPTFIGRESELNALRQLLSAETASIAVVYGRRRVGKTSLIETAYSRDNCRLFAFDGLENQGKDKQIQNFLFQLEQQIKTPITNRDNVKTWSDAFAHLVNHITGDYPTIILLDEFQWMANYRSELVSELKMLWDRFFAKKKNVVLVLCGSIASFIVRKVLKSEALYGRIDLSIHLKPFLLKEAAQFFPERGIEELLLSYIVMGGIPKYLELLKDEPSVALGIEKLAFSEAGYLSNEYDRIFVSHFGKQAKYEKIVGLLAHKSFGLSRSEICAQSLGEKQVGGELTRLLENLESAGFISSYIPFDKTKSSKLIRYLLSDPFLRFYFAFMASEKKKGMVINQSFINNIFPSQKFKSWLGIGFEMLCVNHASVIANILGFGGIEYSAGPYFRHGTKGTLSGVQVDLIFNRADKVLTLCEIKYQDKPIGVEVSREVQQKINKIPILDNKTVQKVLITNSAPTQELLRSSFFSRIISAKELMF